MPTRSPDAQTPEEWRNDGAELIYWEATMNRLTRDYTSCGPGCTGGIACEVCEDQWQGPEEDTGATEGEGRQTGRVCRNHGRVYDLVRFGAWTFCAQCVGETLLTKDVGRWHD
jgi:hypothetical protein